MKRLIVKYVIFFFVILNVVNAVWGGCCFLWVSSYLNNYFRPVCLPTTETLSKMLTDKPSRPQIKTALDKLSRNPDIVMSAVYNEKGKIVFARGPQKREVIIWPLYVKMPIFSQDKTTGWLKVWPAPELIFRELTKSGNLYVLGAAVLFWWVLILISISYYLRGHLYIPLSKLEYFINGFEKDESLTLDASSQFREWRQAFSKLNALYDKAYDTSATLKMLFSVSQTLTSHIEVNEVFGIVLEIIRKKFRDSACLIALPGEDGFLKIKSNRGLSPDFSKQVHVRTGQGPMGLSFQKCQLVVIEDLETDDSPVSRLFVENEGMYSLMCIPLMVESKCIGVLSVGNPVKGFFKEDRVNTISTLAKYLGIALRNSQLYERVQELNRRLETEVSITTRELIQTNSRLIHKVREMKALSDIAAFTATRINLQEILEMVVDKIKELLSAQSVGMFLYMPESNEMVPCAPFFGIKDKDFSHLHFHLGDAKTLEAVLQESKSFVFNEPAESAAAIPILANLFSVHSLVLVPLRSGKKNIGALGVANKFGSPFTQDDLRILELIADRVSGTIDNIRLYQELERRVSDLTVLQEISSAISSEPVWDKTIKKVISTATRAFDADLCAMLIYDEKTRELVTQQGAFFTGGDEAVLIRINVDDPNSHSAQVFRSGEAFVSPDASLDPRIKSQTARLWDVRSLILVPLRAENRVIGVLRIGKHKANCYTKDHLKLASLIAHQAATIIGNAQLYASLKETKNELEHLNQIKNEFISMVSHELRTPLTAVKGFVKVVLSGDTGSINPQQEKFLQIADQSIDRLTILITDLLDISRIESGQMRLQLGEAEAQELIAAVVTNVSAEASKKGLKLITHIPQKFPMLLADRQRLIQVFENLILNSIKFTKQGGMITISASDRGDFVLFSVADTGIGIDKNEQHKIFDKFYQVDSGMTRSNSGTGLGLAIVKSIVEMHGGQIWVESEPNSGANFQFVIPRAKTEIKNFRNEVERMEKEERVAKSMASDTPVKHEET
jgi:signal transduction histidine kinase